MQMLNRYFAPFALILTLSAIYFYVPEEESAGLPRDIKLSLIILATSIVVNWWISANSYRFVGWTRQFRMMQVWMNYVWSVPLVYLLVPYWGPMWLLFMMAPVTAALFFSLWSTLGTAVVSAGTMLAIYYARGLVPEGAALGMAVVHASFIIVFSLFAHSLAQAALRMRDASL